MATKTKKTAARKTVKVSASVMKARATRHAVRAAGKEFNSVREAFEELELPMWRHPKFRKELKAKKQLSFISAEGKKPIRFSIAA